jgi:SAM-dependent methyltransferase
VIGELYEQALTGAVATEIEYADGNASPLPVHQWLAAAPGDESVLDWCSGPTLDVGAGPGRLTVALAERGVPALAIDITPYAVALARSCGVLALQRDVFGRLPGAGRWATVLLADGNIGIGGDPEALLRRAASLLAPDGTVVAEVGPPGSGSRREQVRLRTADGPGPWFPWAWVGADGLPPLACAAGLRVTQTWADSGRWFAVLARADPAAPAVPPWIPGEAAAGTADDVRADGPRADDSRAGGSLADDVRADGPRADDSSAGDVLADDVRAAAPQMMTSGRRLPGRWNPGRRWPRCPGR